MWTVDKVNLSISRVPFCFLRGSQAAYTARTAETVLSVSDAGGTSQLVRDNLRLSRVVD